jgi:hypothetical protein
MRNHTETAQIIQLFAPRPKRGKRMVPIANHSSNPREIERRISNQLSLASQHREIKSSDTAENFRLRQERYDAWRQADAVMDYWHAMMKVKAAISCMQNFGRSKTISMNSLPPKRTGRWSKNIGWHGAS